MTTIEIQKWPGKRRFLITWPHFGSVQIDIYDKPFIPTGSTTEIQAFIYALWINESKRRNGVGKKLLDTAEDIAKNEGMTKVHLDWQLKESPHWVFDWYCKRGYNDVELGKDCALMEKKL